MHPSTAIARELRSVRTSFSRLARSFARIAPLLGKGAMAMATVQEDTRRPRKKPTLSPKQRAALRLQGRYMGTLRGLPAAKQAVVKRVRAEKEIRAAIAEARKMGGVGSRDALQVGDFSDITRNTMKKNAAPSQADGFPDSRAK